MPTVFSYPLVSPFSATQHTLLGCDAVTGEVHRYDLSNLDTLVPIASQAEAEAGTNNAKMMTPLRTAQAIAASAFVKADGTVSMTGQLTLPASNPTDPNHAARKAYVDAMSSDWVKLSDFTPSAATTIDITGVTMADYNALSLLLLGVNIGSTTSNATLQVYRNSSLVTSGYTWCVHNWNNSGAAVSAGSSQSSATWTAGGLVASANLWARFDFAQVTNSMEPLVTMTSHQTRNSGVLQGASMVTTVAGGSGWLTGIRIIAPVNFTATGRIVLMGLRA